jgi:hypothetical protein
VREPCSLVASERSGTAGVRGSVRGVHSMAGVGGTVTGVIGASGTAGGDGSGSGCGTSSAGNVSAASVHVSLSSSRLDDSVAESSASLGGVASLVSPSSSSSSSSAPSVVGAYHAQDADGFGPCPSYVFQSMSALSSLKIDPLSYLLPDVGGVVLGFLLLFPLLLCVYVPVYVWDFYYVFLVVCLVFSLCSLCSLCSLSLSLSVCLSSLGVLIACAHLLLWYTQFIWCLWM